MTDPSSEIVWAPSSDRVTGSRLHHFMSRVSDLYEDEIRTYDDLHRWSCRSPVDFWKWVWLDCGVVGEMGDVPSAAPPAIGWDHAWFPNAELSYAENLLLGDSEAVAMVEVDVRGRRSSISRGELRSRVLLVAGALRARGFGVGDAAAGVIANSIDGVVAMLATVTVGATWSSCSPEFANPAILDRFSQVRPELYFYSAESPRGNGLESCSERLSEIGRALPTVKTMVRLGADARGGGGDDGVLGLAELSEGFSALEAFPRFSFDHPLLVVFSSGTTGVPKCIVHRAGGVLLQHLKEHRLQCDIRSGDVVHYQTNAGWMMWNWIVSALACEATVLFFNGGPLSGGVIGPWKLVEQEGVSFFGTSAKVLDACRRLMRGDAKVPAMERLRTIASTGSILSPRAFSFVYERIKKDVALVSISGGTDLISCFVGGNPLAPVRRGEIQAPGLGMDVRVFGPEGDDLATGIGELVCATPFPTVPLAFLNDPDGRAYRSAYFDRFAGAWSHGDTIERTVSGGYVIHGRSDSVLNPGGVRIGPGEIYRALESVSEVVEALAIPLREDDDEIICLFVVLAAGVALDETLIARIQGEVRQRASRFHVPAIVRSVPGLPLTVSGKISEASARAALNGDETPNALALANPDVLAYFRRESV